LRLKNSFKYEVAISFAEEDRNAAIALALALELAGFNHIYYYPDNLAATAGKTLIPELQKIFLDQDPLLRGNSKLFRDALAKAIAR
jgi:hypothetical protein